MAYLKDLKSMLLTRSLCDWLKQTGACNDSNFMINLVERVNYYSDAFINLTRIDKLAVIKAFYDLIDENIENITPDIKAKIKCKKGCSYCCHIPVTISKAEADYIGYFCKTNNIAISKKYLKKQLQTTEENIAYTSHSACVFLQNQICSIYPARPFNCRAYLIFSDPLMCNVKAGKARPEGYFDYNIGAIISGVFSKSKPGRLPEMLLPYSK